MGMAAEVFVPGEVVLDTYRVERVLGGGGMGVVVAATSLKRGDRVAIKVLQPDKARRDDVVGRFLLEANAVLKIESPHVARVFDVGRLPSGAPYMVMEYLEGTTLAGLVRRQGRLPVETAVDYLLQACEALAEAHVAGIVHRDLKPANLFLTTGDDGAECVKVLDFGVSKMRSTTGMSLGRTLPTEMLGSPYYMAPEQMRSSRDVDARTDIWALGVTLYELTAGKRPFRAEMLPQLMMAILQREPPPLRDHLPQAPAGLVEVIARCLRKDPAERFAGVGELATALAPLAPDHARESIARISRVSRMTPVPSAPESDVVPAPIDEPRSKLPWLLALLLVLVAAAAAVVLYR